MVETIREYRVWCETGDYVGGAEVTYNKSTEKYTVASYPFRNEEKSANTEWNTRSLAFNMAHAIASRYKNEAIAADTETRGEVPEGVMSEHGYNIQIIEGDQDVTGDPST